ncbi:MAG TPA: class I SAM-dependent methyltransferase [Caulobacteraceae bacterium]|nr:class I SAM-dependent methyltransferase [Caulobacteraceae bacterium]
MFDDAFWAVHSDLPREGPGDNASTARALAAMTGLPPKPAILDIACGPGMQTLELAQRSGGHVTAIDLHAPFLGQVRQRARAAGKEDQISLVRASMSRLPFAEGAFDALWCEGAIYIMGFAEGLQAWRRLLKPGGYVAVTEPVLFQPPEETPPAVLAGWAEYPAVTTLTGILARAVWAQYQVVDHFPLPASAWWDGYYGPIEAKLPALRAAHGADRAYAHRIREAEDEIDLYRRHSDTYGYLFVVLQLP